MDRKPAPPLQDGVGVSRVRLPAGSWPDLLSFLCAQFPSVDAEQWRSRFARGRVLDEQDRPVAQDEPYRAGALIAYYRELPPEAPIPFEASVLFQDEHLLVVDKPHFLPVMPAGRFLQETLLVRLKQRLGLQDLVPLHRIDRGTAGVVVFSVNRQTRAQYQMLFPQRRVDKCYEAWAPAQPTLDFPRVHRSRLIAGTPFFRMCEAEGDANSETRIEVMAVAGDLARYRLLPLTGRKHQLRVHLAALGAPIINDPFYPELRPQLEDDYTRPMQLLARSIAFTDPLNGRAHRYDSLRDLEWPKTG